MVATSIQSDPEIPIDLISIWGMIHHRPSDLGAISVARTWDLPGVCDWNTGKSHAQGAAPWLPYQVMMAVVNVVLLTIGTEPYYYTTVTTILNVDRMELIYTLFNPWL